MQWIDLIALYCVPLSQSGVRYMVTGSVACAVYGEPRLTHDLDLVVELSAAQMDLLRRAFPPDEFYFPPEEALRVDLQRPQRGHFNVIHHASGYKADFYLKGRDSLHAWGLENARSIQVGEHQVMMAPPEYVILRKLEFFREGGSEKHLRDVAGVLRSWPELQKNPELQNRLEALGLPGQWQKVLKILQGT